MFKTKQAKTSLLTEITGTSAVDLDPEIQQLRTHYESYVEHVHRGRWKPAKHLRIVCETLEKVERGEIDRLMIFMPPRHSKSQTVTETLPSWFIGKDPCRRVIEVSYANQFAQKFGNANRRKLLEFGQKIFGISLDPSNKSKTNWSIAGQPGGMISVGLGGAITGEGADLLIIDDLIKSREDADSETKREKVWDEWTATLLTRLHPGGRIIVVMTRWHEDDLAGRILKQAEEDGEQWEIINLPCEAEEDDPLEREVGEPLWPERFGKAWMTKKRKAVGERDWASLYQQQPRPKNAIRMFSREWFEIVGDYPRSSKEVRYWDLAATEAKKGKDPDYTAGARVAEKDGVYYIVDIRHGQLSPKGVEDLIRQTAELDTKKIPVHMEQEPGASGVNTIDHYRRVVLKGFPFYGDKKHVDKLQRALPVSSAAEAGNVKIVRGVWNKDFLDQIEQFPEGKHDDTVDAVTGAVAMLANPKSGILEYYRQRAETAKEQKDKSKLH